MQTQYKVTIHSKAQDCDGPMDYGARTAVMTYEELAQQIGFAFMRHGQGVQHEPYEDLEELVIMSFGHNTDEGWSRTDISFHEVTEEEAKHG